MYSELLLMFSNLLQVWSLCKHLFAVYPRTRRAPTPRWPELDGGAETLAAARHAFPKATAGAAEDQRKKRTIRIA